LTALRGWSYFIVICKPRSCWTVYDPIKPYWYCTIWLQIWDLSQSIELLNPENHTSHHFQDSCIRPTVSDRKFIWRL